MEYLNRYYVLDRSYIVLKEFYMIHLRELFFVVKFKKNLRFKCNPQIFK